jgi:hypothetical protein
MRSLVIVLLAVAMCASGPVVFKGFDPEYPKSWPEPAYRQSKLNSELKNLGWPYRIYQSYRDGSCLAARQDQVQGLKSLKEEDGAPKLAFGCERQPAESPQVLSLYGDMVILDNEGGKVFTAGEDPYREVGRYESGTGRLMVTDRARAMEIVRLIQKERGPEYARRVERGLVDKIHDLGDGRMTELTAEADQGHWRYWVKTEDQRPGDSGILFFDDGQPETATAKKDARDDYDDDDDGP